MKYVLLLLSICICTNGWAQIPFATFEGKELQEVYKEDVPVSGHVIAGLCLSGIPLSNILAVLPKSTKQSGKKICVQVMSRDGRYWAENTFLLPELNETDRLVALDYESDYTDLLEDSNIIDLAVLSFAGSCDSKMEREYILTTRDKLSTEKDTLFIYVNSGRTDVFVDITNPDNSERPQPCESITEGRRTAYDTICRLKLEPNYREKNQLQLKLYRRKFGRTLPPVEIFVALPSDE